MPLSPTYPGVYIEEVPSTVRTITGVATSITAFIGRALRGPTDKPRRISNWGEFERLYGGLWVKSSLGYAVNQYFLNGGTDAVIARVHNNGDKAWGASSDTTDSWEIQAAVGTDDIRVTISHNNDDTFNVRVEQLNTDGISWDEQTTVPNLSPGAISVGDAITGTNLSWAAINSAAPPRVGVFPLADAVAEETATASITDVDENTFTLTSALNGELGNHLEAVVTNVNSGASTYDLLIRLVDSDGTMVSSDTFASVQPGNAFTGSPTLLDITDPAPGALPVEGTYEFQGGRDGQGASVTIQPAGAGVSFEASSEGSWGNHLVIEIDHNTSDETTPGAGALINVTVEERDSEGNAVITEVHRNLSMDPEHSRFLETVLAQESDLVRIREGSTIPSSRPPATTSPVEFDNGSDGIDLDASSYIDPSLEASKQGLWLLEKTDLFNLLVIPPMTRTEDVPSDVWIAAMAYCKRRRAVLLVDAPSSWTSAHDAVDKLDGLNLQLDTATNASLIFPRVRLADPLAEFRLAEFAPAGIVAGVIARTDAQQGVWRAPAGIDASLNGVRGLAANLTDAEHGRLNPLGVNVLRTFPVFGTVIWGARTIRGADKLANEWKYLPVRRLALMIEESLYRGTQWAVFEGNDSRLWDQLRLNIKTFMHNLFRQGAFQGSSPRDAYMVKCDAETTPQSDIDRGIVNVLVGFRPLKPAEFVFLKISQLAGQAGA